MDMLDFPELDLIDIVQDILSNRKDKRLNRASTEKLLRFCKRAYSDDVDDNERISTFFVSRELSLRGIAPRWQFHDADDDIPLKHLSSDKTERESIRRARKLKQADKIVFDLVWLSITYPNHITSNDNWQKLFECRTEWSSWFETAQAVVNRRATRSQKAKGLALREEHLIGCRYFSTKQLDRDVMRLMNRRKKIARTIEKNISSMRQRSQINSDEKSLFWVAGKLAEWSPTLGANVFKMMTGRAVSKQLTHKAFTKLKAFK